MPIDTNPSDVLGVPLVVQTLHGCLFSLNNFQMGCSPYLKEREEGLLEFVKLPSGLWIEKADKEVRVRKARENRGRLLG